MTISVYLFLLYIHKHGNACVLVCYDIPIPDFLFYLKLKNFTHFPLTAVLTEALEHFCSTVHLQRCASDKLVSSRGAPRGTVLPPAPPHTPLPLYHLHQRLQLLVRALPVPHVP